MILLSSIPLGILVGWMRGGSLHHLGRMPLRGFPLLIIPLILEYTGGYLLRIGILPEWGIAAVVLTAYLMLITAIWLNRNIPGLGVLAVGFLLNLVVVTANSFQMPLSRGAAARAGLDASFFKPITDSTRLPFLADLIPVPGCSFHPAEVISIGDILIMIGFFLVIQAAMCPPKESR